MISQGSSPGYTDRPLTSEETLSMKPIEGLKVGDQLKLVTASATRKPSFGEVITVSRIIKPDEVLISDASWRFVDFGALFLDAQNQVVEYTFDSRFFARA